MKRDHVTALVSGANRGLGRRIAAELVARGAKVYAGARRPGRLVPTRCGKLCSGVRRPTGGDGQHPEVDALESTDERRSTYVSSSRATKLDSIWR